MSRVSRSLLSRSSITTRIGRSSPTPFRPHFVNSNVQLAAGGIRHGPSRIFPARASFQSSCRAYSLGQVDTSKVERPTSAPEPIGVEAARRALSDPSFVPKPKIFDEFSLKGRVGVVTGGNGGLGLEMALTLCEQGAKVYALDLPKIPSEDFQACAKYAERLGNGAKLRYLDADVTDQERMFDILEKIGDRYGRVDVCVAAAGILQGYHCLEYPAEEFRKVMDVNTNGVFFTAQAAGRQMARFNIPGSIILIASMSGSITNRDHDWAAYNVSKSAVLQMARSMACSLGPQAIRVNSLSPGHIYTKMTAALLDKQPELGTKWSNLNPLGRLGQVHEVRGVIAWLASDASTFCTGSDIMVTGGHHSW